MNSLHCEVLYDSLTSNKEVSNDVCVVRTFTHTLFIMTNGTSKSAISIADKMRHLLCFQPSTVSTWQSLLHHLMSWENDWKHLIAIVDYNHTTNQIMFAQWNGQHIALYRQYFFVMIEQSLIYHQDCKVLFSLIDIELKDLVVVFHSEFFYRNIGHHLGLGWQHDFGLNSDFLMKDRHPCTRLFLNDVMTRLMGHPNKDENNLVAMLQVKPMQETFIMIGPPSQPNIDEDVVHHLMENEKAKKIVCGGTTSDIVARVLNKRIIMIPHSKSDIPPISIIDGIDLVTEGVLTLNKTIELLELLNNMHSLSLAFNDLHKHDGAFHMTRLLCSESTHIHFLIGLAQNADHSYSNVISYETKMDLVNRLLVLLVQLGKHITINFY